MRSGVTGVRWSRVLIADPPERVDGPALRLGSIGLPASALARNLPWYGGVDPSLAILAAILMSQYVRVTLIRDMRFGGLGEQCKLTRVLRPPLVGKVGLKGTWIGPTRECVCGDDIRVGSC